jgi:hypothetical protein
MTLKALASEPSQVLIGIKYKKQRKALQRSSGPMVSRDAEYRIGQESCHQANPFQRKHCAPLNQKRGFHFIEQVIKTHAIVQVIQATCSHKQPAPARRISVGNSCPER